MEIPAYILNYIKNSGKGGTAKAVEISNCNYLFWSNYRIEQLDTLLPLCKPTSANGMFASATNLTAIDGTVLDFSKCTTASGMCSGCTSLTSVTGLDTKSLTGNSSVSDMFNGCSALTTIDVLDLSGVTRISNAFSGCTSLSNDSLNNILETCYKSGVSSSSYKKLSYIGLTTSQCVACGTLPNWQAFVAAGWTTGY